MTAQELRTVHRAQPFRPFFLKLADGSRIPVRHPEFLSLSPSGRTIHVYQPDDSSEVIDLFLVLSLELKNGKTGRRKKGGYGKQA